MSAQTQEDLKEELNQAKIELLDARNRIERIEKIIWGSNPHSMQKDPHAMINILSDIRDKMPDLEQIRSNYKFLEKLKFLLWGNAGLLAVLGSLWALFKFVLPLIGG